MPATSIERTLADLSRRLTLTEGVALVDAALHRRLVGISSLQAWKNAAGGSHGIRFLRKVLEFAEPASESPMESRLRMLLVLAGLPRPRVQAPIHNSSGRFVGRPDLYYESAHLGIEYDGGTHRDSLAEDNRRQNNLLNAGVRLLHFTAADVLGNREGVVRQVREMLRAELPAKRRFEGTRNADLPAN
jgi:very-short-patch-repair endonuclease